MQRKDQKKYYRAGDVNRFFYSDIYICECLSGYLYIPAPDPGPSLGPNLYWPWLIIMGNNKIHRLHMLLFLLLLFHPFVTVIVGRNETKANISKKNRLTDKTGYYVSQVKQKKK